MRKEEEEGASQHPHRTHCVDGIVGSSDFVPHFLVKSFYYIEEHHLLCSIMQGAEPDIDVSGTYENLTDFPNS